MPPLTHRAFDEFAPGAALWPEELDRRDFLQLMGAGLALAGLAGCARPAKTLVPYVDQPEAVVPGKPAFYATAMPIEGYARGIIVETHEGRPTKIEGNPLHSESLGATDAITQASILSLYDPDRSRSPKRKGQLSSWKEFEDEWFQRRTQMDSVQGLGFAFLTEPTTSPTLRREIYRLLDRFPKARWFQHTALERYDREGVQPDFDFAEADIVLSIESDFLFRHPAALRYARSFARRRRIENGKIDPNRLYAIEGAWSVTGAMADCRLATSPSHLRRVLNAIAEATAAGAGPVAASVSEEERQFIGALAADLKARSPRVFCIAGDSQAADVRRWADAMNRRLGAEGRITRFFAPVRSDGDSRSSGGPAALAEAIARGEVTTLAVLGCNPVYTAEADVEFGHWIDKVEFTLHQGLHADETAVCSRWHLPETHYLEAWGDLRGYDGSAVIQQPMIESLYDTRSAVELLRFLGGPVSSSGYNLVRETWSLSAGGPDFEERWIRWLNEGRVDGAGAIRATSPSFAVPRLEAGPQGPALVFRPDPTLGDGRWANNGWLQELPRPFTALVWDNAAWIAPELADAEGLRNGDVVVIEHAGRSVKAPVWIIPGQAADCILVHLGGGRAFAGSAGNHRGFDAYPLRTRSGLWQATPFRIAKTGETWTLASTQHQNAMEGRDLVRVVRVGDLPREGLKPSDPSLYPLWTKDRYSWGMSIDLSTCMGCAACVVACQAENNIPIVGKEQVLRGREMHWIRIDRYRVSEDERLRIVSQPVPCMHCENAPCEVVCPVAATVHSSEGLNEMVYNRCVGTRYCSNNCPYKVRRFNFFDFRAAADSPTHLQDNPNVTVRARGVMEKCTYCVQRINAVRIEAERENRAIRDGEIRTACQQACPVEAIVFGDSSDPESAVSRRKREGADYALLAELNTRPRTTYLPRIVNPPA